MDYIFTDEVDHLPSDVDTVGECADSVGPGVFGKVSSGADVCIPLSALDSLDLEIGCEAVPAGPDRTGNRDVSVPLPIVAGLEAAELQPFQTA